MWVSGRKRVKKNVLIVKNYQFSVLSVFQIVKFNNDACEAVDGTMGTCYTAAECTNKGGEERGNCASGFGVCCVGKCVFKHITFCNCFLSFIILACKYFFCIISFNTPGEVQSKDLITSWESTISRYLPFLPQIYMIFCTNYASYEPTWIFIFPPAITHGS